MLRRTLLALLAAAALLLPSAALAGRADDLIRLLRLGEVLEIMGLEGLKHGEEIGDGLLGPRRGSGWETRVAAIYAGERIEARFRRHLDAALAASDKELGRIDAFFGSEIGQRILELEIGARRAMLDPAVDADARAAAVDLRVTDGDRFEKLERFAAANDLVEQNVVGGLNSTFAFYRGLRDSGAPGFDMTEGDMLAEVSGQEADIRDDIEEWLFGYLALAYSPLAPEEVEAYIAFSEAPEGQLLNAALFAAFNRLFEEVSLELGLAAGQLLAAEDI
jgi:hypothetical protein